MKLVGLVAAAVCMGLAPVGAQPGNAPVNLQGAWRVVSTTGASPSANAQPSLLLFTGRHYSILRVTSPQPRAAVADPAKASAAQLLSMWGNQGFVANAGTYEYANGTLTTHPLVAKNPDVMKAGSIIVYSAKAEGTAVVLTEVRDSDGPVTNPTILRLARLE